MTRKEPVGQKRRGFTLIELLVVISIIGVLSAGAASMFANSQRRARDARRRSDVKAIQSAAEQYYTTCNAYPTSTTNFDNVTPGCPGAGPVTCCAPGTGVSQYLQFGGGSAFPTDPRGGSTDYYEIVSASSTAYQVCADLELNPPNDTIDATWTAAQNSNDFCVSNLQ